MDSHSPESTEGATDFYSDPTKVCPNMTNMRREYSESCITSGTPGKSTEWSLPDMHITTREKDKANSK